MVGINNGVLHSLAKDTRTCLSTSAGLPTAGLLSIAEKENMHWYILRSIWTDF